MDAHTFDYLNAAARLVESATRTAMADDPEALQGLANCLRSGGMVTLTTTFAPTTGLAHLSISVVEPSGESHCLMQTNLERQPLQ